MGRYLFLFLFLGAHLFAGEAFKETRYLYALDTTFTYEGSIHFEEEKITIAYGSPREEIIEYHKEDEEIRRAYFFLILNAIYTNDEQMMHEFFDVEEEGGMMHLSPLDPLRNYIQKVEVKKEKEHLYFLKIYMQNDDWIKIETLR